MVMRGRRARTGGKLISLGCAIGEVSGCCAEAGDGSVTPASAASAMGRINFLSNIIRLAVYSESNRHCERSEAIQAAPQVWIASSLRSSQ